MSITINMTLVARYNPETGRYDAFVKHNHGDKDFEDFTGQGGSPDEARGHLLREMILAGMGYTAVFLDIETEEKTEEAKPAETESDVQRLVALVEKAKLDCHDLEEVFEIDHDRTNNGGVAEIINLLLEDGDDPGWIAYTINWKKNRNRARA